MGSPFEWYATLLFRLPVYLYRWKCGWLLGHRLLLLIHVGRHTGLRRHTVLEVVEYREEGPEAVVMSAFGPSADCLRNIEATPNPEVVIGSKRLSRPTASSTRRRQ
jgi:deazaflavin-dependent oxidoreductase (nitroreductase family)